MKKIQFKQILKIGLISILVLAIIFGIYILYSFINLLFVESNLGVPPEVTSSLIILLLCLIFFLIVFFKVRKTDPLKKPKGIVLIAEIIVAKMEKFVVDNMGKRFKSFAGYMTAVVAFVFLSFTIGLIGLASPMTYYMVPLSLALCTFVLIHFTSAKNTKWGYFKRFIEPLPIFLPINLLSMWAPLISLSFRLFGNAVSGWVLMTLAYEALKALSTALFGLPIFTAPLVAPLLHAYFDIFSGYIQTLVFSSLTMMFIAQEVPDEENNYDAVVQK